MALPQSQRDREYNNFSDNGDGTTSRYVNVVGGLGSLLSGLVYDYLSASYPNSTTEVYTYKVGGSVGTTVATITVTYTNSTKDIFLSAERT